MRKRLLRIQCGVAAITVAVSMASSSAPVLPASVRAAYRAFRDPHLLDAPPPTPAVPATAPSPNAGSTPPDDAPTSFEVDVARAFGSSGSSGVGPDADDADLANLARPDLEIPITRRTMRYLRFYTRTDAGRHAFLSRYRRAAPYRDFIEDSLHDAGLPGDLVWLPAIESGYDTHAVSPVGASGLWQFMPATGAAYGLIRSPMLDERISIAQATRAAVKHLRDLHERFGRWDLALAAYNAGGGRVESAMTRLAGTGNSPASAVPRAAFASLASARLLPEETANYVPQVVAFAMVAANVSELHLDIPDLPAAMDIGELAVPEGTHLETIARAAGIPLALVRDYNPQLLIDQVPPSGGDYLVALPADRVERARAAFPACFDHEVVGEEDTGEDDDVAAESDEPAAPAEESHPFNAAASPALPPTRGVAARGVDQAPSRPAAPEPPLPIETLPAASTPPLHTIDGLKIFTLANGILVRVRREPSAQLARLTVRVGTLDERGAPDDESEAPSPHRRRAPRHGEGGASESSQTILVTSRYLAAGMDLAGTRLKLMLDAVGSASLVDVRRRAGAARLRALTKAPDGAAWIALGNALFPPGHPLAGTVLGASQDLDAQRMLLVADLLQSEHPFARASITVVGDVDENVARALAETSLRTLVLPGDLPIAPARPARVLVEESMFPPRVLLAWLAPAEGADDDASLRVLMEILDNPRLGRLHRALVERDAAASAARANLELGLRASVATFELTLAVGHDLDELERRFDAELTRLAAEGPSPDDVGLARSLLRARIEAELADGEAGDPARGPASAASLRRALMPSSTDSLLTGVDAVTVDSVKSMIHRVFAKESRVVVVAAPGARAGNGRIARQ